MVKRTIQAGEFKAKCLALLDEVGENGMELVITKHGRPVARLVPIDRLAADGLHGSIVEAGDLVTPVGEG